MGPYQTSFFIVKETVNKMKKQPTSGENSCKQFNWQRQNLKKTQTHTTQQKKPSNPIEIYTEELNKHSSKEDIRMATRHMKKMFNITN